jgi:hypothetical protein
MDNPQATPQQTTTQTSQPENVVTYPEHIYYENVPSGVIQKLTLIKKKQYAGIFVLVFMIGLGGAVILNIPRMVGDVRTRAGLDTPKPTPLFCDAKCGSNGDILCPKPMECINGTCRNPNCSSDSSCLCQMK